jgi:hypothetical protein
MTAAATARLAALRQHLDATLFPPPRDPAPRNRWAERAAVTVGLLVVGTLLVMLRAGWSASLHTIWAEDGSIFLHGAVTEGSFEKIFAPYANYLVLVPRLIGEATTAVPLEDAPKVISGLSAFLVAVSGLVVWHATGGHLRSPWLRGALAIATVLAPVSGLESLDSGSYVSWYMLFATFWVLLWRPATTWGATLAALFVLAAGLSNPGVWFLIPLALLRGVAIRDRRDVLIVAGFALGALVQMPVAASNHEQIYNPTWTSDILTAYLQRVIDGGVFGQELGGRAWAHLGWAFLIVLTLAAVIAFAGGFWRGNRGSRYLTAIALLGSVGIFLVSLYQRAVGPEMIWPGGAFNGSGGRYVIIPALLLLSAAAVLLDAFVRRSGRARWAPWLGAALVGLAVITSFDLSNSAARGVPTWEQSLQAAAWTCLAERNAEALVEVAPPGVGFNVALPCERIASQAGG